MTVKMKLLNATILAAITSTAYAEQQKHHFDIPAQALGSALQTLAAQSGVPMLYAEQTAAGKQSPRLSGDYTIAEAAGKLLAGSGLVHSVAENGTVTVKPAASTSPVTLKPMTVTGKTEDDPKSYIATRTASATKTDTPIMETPQSIQVIKRTLIDDQQNITISESLLNVSGVVPNIPAFTPANEDTLIRGFKAEQLLDGFTQYYSPGDRESNVNVERLEVLKGSNGVLYSGGSGSPVGGLVNIVSKLPQAVASRELGFRIGTNNYYQPYLDINQPLTKNILARFTGGYTNAGSYLDNINTQRYNLNPTLTFTNNDTTSFTVHGKISRWEQPEYQGLPATGTIAGNFSIPRNSYLGPSNTPDSRSESDAVWGTFDHKFNSIWSMIAALRQLEMLVGKQPGALAADLKESGAVPTAPGRELLASPAATIRHRPDLLIAERRLAAATAMHGVAVAELFPKISLSAFLGLRNTDIESLLKSAAFSYSTTSNLMQPLLNFGRIRAGIDLAKAKQSEAYLAYEKAVLEALRDTETTLTRYLKEEVRRQILGKSVEDQRESVLLSELRYREGVISFLDVLDAQRALYAAEIELARSEAEASTNLIAFYKTLGGGADATLPEVAQKAL